MAEIISPIVDSLIVKLSSQTLDDSINRNEISKIISSTNKLVEKSNDTNDHFNSSKN
jgi:hypothetical protein